MPKIKKIFVGTQQVRPHQIPDTKIAYFPFEEDILDHWNNNISMTNWDSGVSYSFSTLASGKKVLYSSNGWGAYSSSNFVSTYLSDHQYTVSLWASVDKSPSNRRNHFMVEADLSWWRAGLEVGVCTRENSQSWREQVYYVRGGTNGLSWTSSWNGRHHIVETYNNGTGTVYINGSLYVTVTCYNITDWYLWITPWGSWDGLHWYMSEFILDWKVWTAEEVADYYNQTKAEYWL